MTSVQPDLAGRPVDTPPSALLMDLLLGVPISQTLSAAAELGVAEQLVDGPRTAEDVAAAICVDAPSLYRLLRALVGIGMLTQEGDHFMLTPAGGLMRGDVPGSFRALAIMRGRPWYHMMWTSLANSVRTGKSAFLDTHGTDQFEWFRMHPDESAIFNAAMTSLTGATAGAVAEAYDFSGVARVADIGGGHGVLLSRILQLYPSLHGVLFDSPHVVDGAESLLRDAGLSARCELMGGDFFASVPAGCDAYVLAHILHDWDDAHCETILGHCREAMGVEGRVLLVELIVPSPGVPSLAGIADLQMLAITSSGRERTEQEFADLLASAGLELRRVIPTASRDSVLEAFRA